MVHEVAHSTVWKVYLSEAKEDVLRENKTCDQLKAELGLNTRMGDYRNRLRKAELQRHVAQKRASARMNMLTEAEIIDLHDRLQAVTKY